MDEHGKLVATNPDAMPGVASVHVSALYSLFPNASWRQLAAEWVEAQGDPEKLQPFVNLVLGETWEDRSLAGAVKEPHELERLCVPYEAELPEGVRVLTAGVDVQSRDGGRFEVKVVGWGASERGAIVGHWILDDHPLSDPAAWAALSELLSRSFLGPDGRAYRVSAAAIDSGGHYTQEVYSFCARNASRNWWAIKGRSNAKGARSDRIWPTSPSKGKRGGLVFSIDQDICKDAIFRRLHGEPDKPGGLIFPEAPLDGSVPCDAEYFKRLTREKPMPVKGRPIPYWSSPVDQEPWDCLVYAYAATHGLRALANGQRYLAMLGAPGKFRAPTPAAEAPVEPGRPETAAAPVARPSARRRKPRVMQARF